MELKKIVKATGKEIKERVDPRTTGSLWKRVRNIAGIVAFVGGVVIAAPVSLPTAVVTWITWLTATSAGISGAAWLDKSGKK